MFALVLAIAGTASATPLQPHKRAEFVVEMSESCIDAQTRNPANRDISAGVIRDFCNCAANEAANTLTQEAADYMDRTGDPKPATNASLRAAEVCAAKIFG
ncbi:hypothetical protein [Stenotrophomonas sp.]|uniref:hypothetical protein n=1 Tax=Stenotrophomonas sp. TaxID=69392 RepID=UPI0028B1DF9A|nr:hypothetical protein [Stenotrophomonas sp.]